MNLPTLSPRLTQLADEARSFSDDLRDWVRGGLIRVSGIERRALAERFAAWADQENNTGAGPEGSELRAWVGGLDEQGHEALTEQLSDFCEAFDIELAWLVDGELADWPQLEELLRLMATRYCLACKAGVDADDGLQQFRRRLVWQRKSKKRNSSRVSAGSGAPN